MRTLRPTSPERSNSRFGYGGYNWTVPVSITAPPPRSLQGSPPPITTTNTSTLPAKPTFSPMQAIKLQRKFPEVSQEEMFDLINRFKYVKMLSSSLYALTS